MPDRKFRISSKLIIILRFKDSGTIIGTLYQNCVWKLYLDTFIVLNITSIDNKVTIRHLEPQGTLLLAYWNWKYPKF